MRLIDADKLIEDIKEWGFIGETCAIEAVNDAPSIELVRCKECIYYDPPHVEDDGERIEYSELPEEAFDKLGTRLVSMDYGVNIGGRCCVDYNCGYAEDKRVYRAEENFCSKGKRQTERSE